MRTPAERGPFGQRLVDERTARGWTQKEMLAYLESVGIPLAHSVYAAYESGSQRPQAARRERIEAMLTETKESPGAGDTLPGLSSLIDRLDRQAELMTEYIEVTRELIRLVGAPERSGQPPPSESGPEARKILKRSAERAETEEPPALSQSVSPIPIRSAQRG